MKKLYLLIGIASLAFSCSNDCATGAVCGDYNIVGPRDIPTPTPTATPIVSPNDPCAPPVTAVYLSGPLSVGVGETFKVDVTPVNASGPLQGNLDYCNLRGRVIVVESLSANLRCVGQCQTFGPQFLAQAVGPFSIRIRVDNATGQFEGTVLK